MTALRIACLALGFTAFSGAAQAQLVVLGKGEAAACYQYSLSGNQGSRTAIETCSEAFKNDISYHDEAATYVNRGVLLMRKGDTKNAIKDYKTALEMKPSLTEAQVNYGAALIRSKDYPNAVKVLTVALEDETSYTRAQALYNRAIAYDHQENYRSAYRDVTEILAIRPDWKPALDLMSRYEVRSTG